MRFIQLTVTEDQAELIAQALREGEAGLKLSAATLKDAEAEEGERELLEEDARQLGRLALLFQDASENPSKYTPEGKQAATVRSIVRRAKGAAQPQSRRNKRKARQEERQRTSKARRELRKRFTAAYNEARERVEAEQREAEGLRREEEARIEAQPKYTVVTTEGEVILSGIPAEFILNEAGENLLPKVIVP